MSPRLGVAADRMGVWECMGLDVVAVSIYAVLVSYVECCHFHQQPQNSGVCYQGLEQQLIGWMDRDVKLDRVGVSGHPGAVLVSW